MRLRNVKNKEEILEKSHYYIKEPTHYKGKWSKVFKNNNPIMLEIGMGKGDFIIGMAKLHPEWNFIGIEKYDSVLVRALLKLENENLNNLYIASYDAIDLANVFLKEVDTIYLNFSDPWPKKRHYKRRLTYRDYLKVYDLLFKGDSNLEIKTDNDTLFESTLIELNNYGYTFNSVCLDLWNSDKENIKTEYEIKFSNKGFKIKYLSAKKSRQED